MSASSVSVNIVCMDHYLHSPIKDLDPFMSEFRAATVERLPILRIYGSTYEGIKACVHIHGVFPYFYVPCEKDCSNPLGVAYQIASAVDKAINITLNQATSSQQHIYRISLEKGIPFYGYHQESHQFFKLSFYNPTMIKKASALLQSGNIMGTIFQPFECHIQYKQQFMIDFNLFGMNFVRFANPRYRDDITLKKQSVCPLEFDVLADDILNQYDIIPGNVPCNPGIQYIRDEEMKRDGISKKDNENLKIESNLTQNRVNVEPTITDLNYRDKLRAMLKNKSSQRSGTSMIGENNHSNLNDSTIASNSLLDLSVLDNTQLEEDVQIFMQLLNDNLKENAQTEALEGENESLDEDCVLSQIKSNPSNRNDVEMGENSDGEDDLNFTLIDFMSSLELKGFDEKELMGNTPKLSKD